VDTRPSQSNPSGPLAGPSLAAKQTRSFPLQSGTCNIPSNAQAYSLNATAIPPNGADLSFLVLFPTGQQQPGSSTLNAPTGTTTANAAIVPAGTGGAVSVFTENATDLLLDINGYFAPPGPVESICTRLHRAGLSIHAQSSRPFREHGSYLYRQVFVPSPLPRQRMF